MRAAPYHAFFAIKMIISQERQRVMTSNLRFSKLSTSNINPQGAFS